MSHLYKGKDRRMIQKVKKLLEVIIARDQRALDSRPTTALSTRLPILDYDDTEGGVLWAANQVLVCMINDLAAPVSMRSEPREKPWAQTSQAAPSPENPK